MPIITNHDRIAAEDHSYKEERARFAMNGKLSLNSAVKNGQMKQKPNYAEAVKTKKGYTKRLQHASQSANSTAKAPLTLRVDGQLCKD